MSRDQNRDFNTGTDELFDLKAAFYLGNYQQAINEAHKVKTNNQQLQVERDVYMYRSYIAQKKYAVVLDDIKANTTVDELNYVKVLAKYLSTPQDQQQQLDDIVSDLDSKIASLNVNNPTVLLLIANIYYLHENYETALKVLNNADSSLECSSLVIQIYLKMDRIDLAKRELKKLCELDEDAIITQITTAWVNLVSGEKVQDAFFTFQELADKHQATSLLLNNEAVCELNQGVYDEAQSLLQQALDKDNNNPDILVNMIVLCQHMGKPIEITNRYITQLKDSHKNHPFVKDFINKENEFNRLAKNYYPSVTSSN